MLPNGLRTSPNLPSGHRRKTSAVISSARKGLLARLRETFSDKHASSLGADFRFRFLVQIWQEHEHFVALCPTLQVTSYGDNKKEALENIKEAVELFVEVCIEDGTLSEVLRECGMKDRKQSGMPEALAKVQQESLIQGSVPMLAG